MPEQEQLYGWTFKQPDKTKRDLGSFAPRIEEDGASVVSEGGATGSYVDLEGSAKSEAELVTRYRGMAQQPECDLAIQDVVDEAIVDDPDQAVVKINLDQLKGEKLKRSIAEEWDNIYRLLNFQDRAYEIFQHWYIDGR